MTGRLAGASPRSLWRFGWVLPVLLTAGLYGFTLHGPFVFDDVGDIVSAPWVHRLWPPDWLGHSRRPLVALSWALNWAWTGERPWSFRLVNIVVHAANAALLWGCVRAALRTVPAAEADPAPRDEVLATAASTLWAVHPLHTTAVTYIVHRYESAAALFMLATLAAWQSATVSPRPRRWVALAALCAVLAVLSKEIGVVGPALLVGYDLAFARASQLDRAARARGLAGVALAAWSVAARVYVTVPASASQGVTAGLGRLDYFRSEMPVLVHYLRLTVAPWPLSVDYSDWPISRAWRLPELASLLAVGLLFGAAARAFVAGSRRLGWLGLVCFAVLAPTSTLIPLARELAAERRMYLPLAALAVLLVLGLHRVTRGRWALLGACTVVAAAGLAAVTVHRNRQFETCATLFRHDAAVRPRNGRLQHNLGACLEAQGRTHEAWASFSRALRADPGCCASHQRMYRLAARLGWNDLAMQHITAQLRETPDDPQPWLEAVDVQLAAGDDARALRVAQRTAARFPADPKAVERVAWVLATARDPAVFDGPRSLREARRAMAMTDPRSPPVSRVVALAAALAANGETAEARRMVAVVLASARAARAGSWTAILPQHLAAYEAGQRWIESGRRWGEGTPGR
jgi:tetratricopeptide (TPR) repeat protein